MNNLHSSFVLTFLQENYPNILKEIDRHYQKDVDSIDNVINRFIEYYALDLNDIIYPTNGRALKHRYRLIGCILYLFQPSKLNSSCRLYKPIADKIKNTLNFDSEQLKRNIRATCNLYLYKDFKTDIIQFCNVFKMTK